MSCIWRSEEWMLFFTDNKRMVMQGREFGFIRCLPSINKFGLRFILISKVLVVDYPSYDLLIYKINLYTF